MTPKLFFAFLYLLTTTSYCQTHFSNFKSPQYAFPNIEFGSSIEDSTKFDVINFKNIPSLKDLKIHLKQVSKDSSKIFIYRSDKLIQTISLPFMFWYLDSECWVADLDNNKKQDIKLTIEGGGAGLAGELAYKVYLFNYGSKFKLLSFYDFSHEKEYDLNNDGVYEILSSDHVTKGGHSYFVFNAFDFSNGKLDNISKSINYPLWTKHLFNSRNVVATNISQTDRNKEFKVLPDETIIK